MAVMTVHVLFWTVIAVMVLLGVAFPLWMAWRWIHDNAVRGQGRKR